MDTTVICIVPVRNESWILPNFLGCAQKWADHIIVGDHNSKDESVSIARQFEKVQVVALPDLTYDESTRKKILIDEARKIPGQRLIFSIDADEMLSDNWSRSPDWDLMRSAAPGTRFVMDWLEVLPGIELAAVFRLGPVAFMDDGTEYVGTWIHSPRIPTSTSGPEIYLSGLKLLHFIVIDPDRMFSRHRWYKCIELIENGKGAWRVSVTYQDTAIKCYDAPVIPIQKDWVEGYDWLDAYRRGVNRGENIYWWDEEVMNYFDRYGTARFRRLNIWDVDWNAKARIQGRTEDYADPRHAIDRFVHRFIQRHRAKLKFRKGSVYRLIDRVGGRLWT